MDSPGRLARARRDRDRAGSGGKRAANPEAKDVIPGTWGAPKAGRGPEELRSVAPGTASDDTTAAIAPGPGSPVRGRLFVVGMITVLHPFPDIADQVVQTEPVGRE
jgi:hypothetical protein